MEFHDKLRSKLGSAGRVSGRRSGKSLWQTPDGFTLIELIVLIAIVAFMTLALLASGTSNLKVERFSGGVKELANELRESQVNSYSIKHTGCASPSDPYCDGNHYIRGYVLELVAGRQNYDKARLLGGDLTAFQGEFNQKRGITAKRYEQDSPLPLSVTGGITLERIWINCSQPFTNGSDPGGYCDSSGELSIAFLGPDGRAFVADSIYNSYASVTEPYDNENMVILVLGDTATNLTGYVTFYTQSGNIDVKVE